MDKTKIDQLSDKLKTLQVSLDDKKLPLALTEANDDVVKAELGEIRKRLNSAIEELVPDFEQVHKMMVDVETGAAEHIRALEWNQVKD